MRTRIGLLLLALALSASGCQSIRIEAGLKRPAELTATARARAVRLAPTSSPGLSRLAYVQGGDIWVRELPDGEPERLTHDGHNHTPLWSPSGEWLAFQKEEPPLKEPWLWLMRRSGADARRLALVGAGAGSQVTWSPVADQLAFITGSCLMVLGVDEPAPRPLVSTSASPEGAKVTAIAWSPDGQWIAWESLVSAQAGPPQEQGIWRVRADGSEIKEVYLNPDPVATQSYLAGWSPDGQSVLFWQGWGMSASLLADGVPLMGVAVTGGQPAELSRAVLLDPDFLAWSPEGQRLAVVEGTGRETWQNKAIYMAGGSGEPQRLSDAERADLYPAWSPDGRWLAFTGGPAPGESKGEPAWQEALSRRRIWIMAADGSEKHPLTGEPDCRDERPQWSADGQYILYARLHGEQAQVWLMRADGSEARPVVHEMTPSPHRLGYYGLIDWERLYDWWVGPPEAQPTPRSPATATPRPAQTPPAGGAWPLTAIRANLDEQWQAGASLETMAIGLGQAAAQGGVQVWVLAVPPQGPEQLPMILVAYRMSGRPVVEGQAILWWQDGELRQHEFSPESGPGGDSEALGSDAVFVDARQQLRDGTLELGVVYDANSGGSAPVQVYRLLRLEEGGWRTLWDGLRDGAGQWKTSHTLASLGSGGTLDMVTVRSSSWQYDDGKGGFFHESNPGPHRYFADTWVRQGDRYELAESRVEPSAYATLVEFVYCLSRGEDAKAARWVTDAALVERARAAGLGWRPGRRPWLIDLESPEVEQRGPIRFVEGPAVTVAFEQRGTEWLISGITETPGR